MRLTLINLLILGLMTLNLGRAFGETPSSELLRLPELAKVTDLKAKAALEVIVRKQAEIKEANLGEVTNTISGAAGTFIHAGRILMRRGGLYSYQHLTSAPGTVLDGDRRWEICNGKTCWQVFQKAPQSLARQVEKLKERKIPPEMIQKISAGWTKMRISSLDLERLRQGGVPEDRIKSFDFMLNPLMLVDLATLKLAEETPDAWTFSATFAPQQGLPKDEAGKMVLQVVYSKADGLARKISLPGANMVTIDKVQVNPNPPIPDAYFNFIAEPGMEVSDGTNSLLSSVKPAKP